MVDSTVTIGGIPVSDDGLDRITVNSFLAGGGDGFSVLVGATNAVTGPIDLDALTAHLPDDVAIPSPSRDRISTIATEPSPVG